MRPALALPLLALATLVPAQVVVPARAGLLYYAYGDIRIDGVPPTESQTVNDRQTVAIARGRAEFLLGSGAVLWLDENSTLRFDSTALDDVRVTLLAGRAILELVKLPKEARIAVNTDIPARDGIYTYGGASPEFRRWAAFRSFQLFLQRGQTPRNWERSANNPIARHKGFQLEFPAQSPYLFYAIDYRAGLLSHAEGDVSRRAPAYLAPDTAFSTRQGVAEVFLGRGITLRLAQQSSARLLDTNPAHPAFVLDRGVALLEIAESARTTPLKVHIGKTVIEPARNGLYLLDHNTESLLIYEGEVRARVEDRVMSARSSQRLNLATLATPTRFDTKQRDAFFRWCALRSLSLYFAGGGLLGDWKPPINRLVWHKHFGTHSQYPPRNVSNLEAALRAALLQTAF